jgi:phosphoribosyl 1,2-cyclic phosphate phosphodiesterase
MNAVRLIFLGTGTSVGIPMIGCACAVCRSADPRNRRCRSSIYVVAAGKHLLIDASLDFRMQALTHNLPRIDAVLTTHSHADHIFGLDDLRRYNTLQKQAIPVYGSADTVADLNRIFDYIHKPAQPGTYRPNLDFIVIEAPFQIGDIRVTPIPVKHAQTPTFGFRLDVAGRALGYVPDCNAMPELSLRMFRGVDVMILDGLRFKTHSTHLTIEESAAILGEIGARHSFITHMCHEVEHGVAQTQVPPFVTLAHDGLTLEW